MNTCLDCIPCALRHGLDAARLITDDERIHEQIVREILKMQPTSILIGLHPGSDKLFIVDCGLYPT